MHSMKVILALSLVLATAFAMPTLETVQEGEDLEAAKRLLATALNKLPGVKYQVVNWLSTEAVTLITSVHKYVVDVSYGSDRNECTFTITRVVPHTVNGTFVEMECQGGYKLEHTY